MSVPVLQAPTAEQRRLIQEFQVGRLRLGPVSLVMRLDNLTPFHTSTSSGMVTMLASDNRTQKIYQLRLPLNYQAGNSIELREVTSAPATGSTTATPERSQQASPTAQQRGVERPGTGAPATQPRPIVGPTWQLLSQQAQTVENLIGAYSTFIAVARIGTERTSIQEIKTQFPATRLITMPLRTVVRLVIEIENHVGPNSLMMLNQATAQRWRQDQQFIDLVSALRRVKAIPGITNEIQQTRDAQLGQDQRARDAVAQQEWLQSYGQDQRSRITLGEIQGPWEVVQINRAGWLMARRITDQVRERFTFDQWYLHRAVFVGIAGRFEQNAVIQFLRGLVDGVGDGIAGVGQLLQLIGQLIGQLISHPVQSLTQIWQLLQQAWGFLKNAVPNVTLAGMQVLLEQIWDSLTSWLAQLFSESTPRLAYRIGRTLGLLLFDLLLTKGLGQVRYLQRVQLLMGNFRSRRIAFFESLAIRWANFRPALEMVLKAFISSNRLIRITAELLQRAAVLTRTSVRVASQVVATEIRMLNGKFIAIFEGAGNLVAELGVTVQELISTYSVPSTLLLNLPMFPGILASDTVEIVAGRGLNRAARRSAAREAAARVAGRLLVTEAAVTASERALAQILVNYGKNVTLLPTDWGKAIRNGVAGMSKRELEALRDLVRRLKLEEGLALGKNPDALIDGEIWDFIAPAEMGRGLTLNESSVSGMVNGIHNKVDVEHQARRIAILVDQYSESLETIKSRVIARAIAQGGRTTQPFGSSVIKVILVTRVRPTPLTVWP
jgi:hypothetical protein